ncbi:MAG: hypothetical protein U9R05_05215 [Chloroflexota bacterium]|nr:hypothetical protein [Chloroflexota bacterium]
MIARFILALVAWIGIATLQIVLMKIAQFFERNSGTRSWYRAHLLPLVLNATGAGIYLLHIIKEPVTLQAWPDFTGDPQANLCLFLGGILLILLGARLRDEMIGGDSL